MKNLLHKTLRYFTIYALVVLTASVPIYYYMVDDIWLTELDEHNQIIADKTSGEINGLQLSDAELRESVVLWNKIQPGTNLQKVQTAVALSDSLYTIRRRNPHVQNNELKRYRGLKRNILLNGQPYLLTVETNVEETEETVMAIAIVTFIFFLILVIGFLLLNRRLSVHVWKPFRDTLTKLKSFQLNSQTGIIFQPSDTTEFEELNAVLTRLIEQNISIYKTQKEFAENASHELQTPLAILKNKLDLLLQKESVTDRQYQLVEEMNGALTRIARINKNLLLLAKIENHQFDENETIPLSQLVMHCIDTLQNYFEDKDLQVKTAIQKNVSISGNRMLLEILVNNLLLNAIRHSAGDSLITITLTAGELSVVNPSHHSLVQENLFQRFGKQSAETAGSGLGLPIIKEICHRHGWQVGYHFEQSEHHFTVRF